MKKLTKSELKIIEAAKSLFWKFGIKKTTVEEIVKIAGISKMTFYRCFANKEEVLNLILTDLMEDGLKSYQEMIASELSFHEKVAKTIEMEKEQLNRFSEEFISEATGGLNNQFTHLIGIYQKKVDKITIDFFKESQKEGWIRKDMKIPFILYQLNALNQKASDPELLKLYSNSKDLIIDLIKHFFYGIISTEKE